MWFENKWFSGCLSGFLCAGALVGVSPCAEAADEAKWTNSLGMEFIRIPAGSFPMGADGHAEKAGDAKTSWRHVTIGQPFYLGKTEVTQAQWMAVMGNNPSRFKGRDNPVERVSWLDVQEFIARLNRKEGTKKYRLPTEAEWEYAARAGTTTKYFFGNGKTELGQYAWYWSNSGKKTHPAGQKKPNPWGLHDVYGNVSEWVQDWYGKEHQARGPATDPGGPSTGSNRVLRGGNWYCSSWCLRSAHRSSELPNARLDGNGFRLAFSP